MREAELREQVVDTARSWLGWREQDGSYRPILDLYNCFRPLPRGYRLREGDPWCAAAVSALAIATGLTELIPVECSCARMIGLLKGRESWTEDDGFRPRLGDLLFYDWDDCPGGAGEDLSPPEHVGVVETVSGDRFTVIEGNRNRAVARRQMRVNGRFIRGYGTPRYALAAASRSIDELSRLGVLLNGSYWRQELLCGGVAYLGELFSAAAGVIRRPGPRAQSPEAGLAELARRGVVLVPAYWAGVMAEKPNIAALMAALGGAVGVNP